MTATVASHPTWSSATERGSLTSRRIASYLGPVVMVVAASEAVNVRIWATGLAPLTYQAGLIWLLGGLAILRVHNRWSRSWATSITVVGWFFFFGGLFRMFLPEAQQGTQNTPAVGIYALDAVLFALGVLMAVRGYWPRAEREAP
jgi:hypothetical protein